MVTRLGSKRKRAQKESTFDSSNKDDGEIENIEKQIFTAVKTPIERYYVTLTESGNKIWTLSANTKSENMPVVIVHGLCAGIGHWIHIIDNLAENNPLYAFDLLGFARSSRPHFSEDPVEAEAQYVESIEQWRREMNLKKFVLFGHSFGGYLTCAYALKYPQHVHTIVLIDPWGMAVNSKFNADAKQVDQKSTDKEKKENSHSHPIWVSALSRFTQKIVPLSLFRATGSKLLPVMRHMKPDYSKKFVDLLDDPDLIYHYFYQCNRPEPTGEIAFRTISECFFFAKRPMLERIHLIEHIPIYFIYGGNSWIESKPGFQSATIHRNTAPTFTKIIVNAKHHVYADQPKEFNEYTKLVLKTVNESNMVKLAHGE